MTQSIRKYYSPSFSAHDLMGLKFHATIYFSMRFQSASISWDDSNEGVING